MTNFCCLITNEVTDHVLPTQPVLFFRRFYVHTNTRMQAHVLNCTLLSLLLTGTDVYCGNCDGDTDVYCGNYNGDTDGV